MASDQDLVVQTVRGLLAKHEPFDPTPERRWDGALWSALAENGLTGVGLPEEAGGSGGDLADAVAIVRTVTAGAGAVPVAEHLLVAGPALVAAGLTLPPVDEPMTFAIADAVTVHPVDDGDGPGRFMLDGTVTDVAWGGAAPHVVVLAPAPGGIEGAVLALVDASSLTATGAVNLAGEPRGALVLDRVAAAAALLTVRQARELRAGFALARAVQLAAALEQVLAWTVQYAGERQQFGRALAKFQAIQMELAKMAGEVTAVTALTDAAVQALGHGDGNFALAAAAAKVRAGAAVEVVARLAHQVHGAIGFTQEHKLHHLTKRLWSWRDEAGSELVWSRVLAEGLLIEGPDGLWPALTRAV